MAEEDLREGEARALESSQADFSSGHKTNVTGVVAGAKSGKLKSVSIKTFGVIVAVIALVILFTTPIYAIDAISTRLIEETDVQYADSVENKAVVFQNALENGNIPQNTFERLQQEGVEVGYMDGDTFVASRLGQSLVAANNDTEIIYKQCTDKCTALSIKLEDGTVIPASQFYQAVNSNVELYNAFTNATYGRAAYYYDEEAQRVFREIGTSRNNYGGDEDFETLMNNLMGSGHNFGVNNETWHYMPHWALRDPKKPSSAYIDYWTAEQDNFNCSGTSNGKQIPYWNNYRTVYREKRDPKTGALLDWWYDIYDVAVADSSYGCTTSSSDSFITMLAQSNMTEDGDSTQTTLNTIDSLKVTDTISKEKRSMLLYAGVAESFSRTKAGYGSTNSQTNSILAAVATIGVSTGSGADVNDVMNWLYEPTTTTMPSINGGTVTTTGSALESPSLYAILTGESINASEIENYSSDRILKRSASVYRAVDAETMKKTMTSVGTGMNGNVDRYTLNEVDESNQNTSGSAAGLMTTSDCVTNDVRGGDGVKATPSGYNIEPDCYGAKNRNTGNSTTIQNVANDMINQSMYDNSFSTISGINAGEMLVEGAVNVGKELAKASGASAGNENAVNNYLKLTSDVLAMDAAADRLNRSPLDVTSKNTFLGSIVYKFAVSTMKSGSLLNKMASVSRVTASAVKNILPSASADDGKEELYLAMHGDCDTLGNIDAVGSGTCAAIATFDTSTYENAYTAMDGAWLNDNVTCSGSTCTPKSGSKLEEYINFVELRETPMGITDGQIVDAAAKKSDSGGNLLQRFTKAISNLLTKVANVLGASKEVVEGKKEVPDEATGKTYVVGGDDWEDYKLAQRYIGLARAAETMRQYDGDETAYNFEGFGLGNPIARYIEGHSEDRIAASEAANN